SVQMVWATDEGEAGSFGRASEPVKKSKKGGKTRTGSGSGTRRGVAVEGHWLRANRAMVETGGLALALVLIGGFIGYMLWPPSAPYLYHQAERLMASKDSHDWSTALEEYVEPL